MKRTGVWFLAALFSIGGSLLIGLEPAAGAPTVQAAAAVLMDAESGAVLYEKAPHEARPVASTTKIMTALLAIESGRLDEDAVATDAVRTVGGSSIYLEPGNAVSMGELLAALLLRSANDAAVVMAEHLSGSVEAFVSEMNARAIELGATETNFVNPHGLYDSDHVSSAHDLALIAREALKHPLFRELVATKVAKLDAATAVEGPQLLINHNKLLWRADFVDGVKTGFVRQSGHCLVASGTMDGWRLIAVTLDSPHMYDEALSLLEYGFNQFHPEVYARRGEAVGQAVVRGGVERSVRAVCASTLSVVVGPGRPRECALEVALDEARAPVEEGDRVGRARLVADGQVVAESPLIAGAPVPQSWGVIAGVWVLRIAIPLCLATLLVRTYAKALKAHRRGRRDLAP